MFMFSFFLIGWSQCRFPPGIHGQGIFDIRKVLNVKTSAVFEYMILTPLFYLKTGTSAGVGHDGEDMEQ